MSLGRSSSLFQFWQVTCLVKHFESSLPKQSFLLGYCWMKGWSFIIESSSTIWYCWSSFLWSLAIYQFGTFILYFLRYLDVSHVTSSRDARVASIHEWFMRYSVVVCLPSPPYLRNNQKSKMKLFIQSWCHKSTSSRRLLKTPVVHFPLFSLRISGQDSCKGGRFVTPQLFANVN